jgi:hypothetical protein
MLGGSAIRIPGELRGRAATEPNIHLALSRPSCLKRGMRIAEPLPRTRAKRPVYKATPTTVYKATAARRIIVR